MRTRAIVLGTLLVVATAAPALPARPPVDIAALAQQVEQGDAAAVEGVLRELLRERDDPVLRDLLAVALLRQSRAAEAERELLTALALAPDLAAARVHLARLYLLAGREQEALPHLRRAARLGDLDHDLALKLATLEIAGGSPENAVAVLRDVVARFDSSRARLLLARVLSAAGDTEGALAAVAEARQRAPNSRALLAEEARLAFRAGRPVRAVVALEALVRMFPADPEYPYLLGVARLQAGDAAGASEALARADHLAPGRLATLLALGLALNGQLRFVEARGHLQAALDLAPDDPSVLAGLAETADALDDTAGGERLALAALERAPGHPLAALVLGTVRMRQQRYEEARLALEQAVVADPRSSKAHYQLALAWSRLGEAERAREHFERYRSLRLEEESRLRQLEGFVDSRGGM